MPLLQARASGMDERTRAAASEDAAAEAVAAYVRGLLRRYDRKRRALPPEALQHIRDMGEAAVPALLATLDRPVWRQVSPLQVGLLALSFGGFLLFVLTDPADGAHPLAAVTMHRANMTNLLIRLQQGAFPDRAAVQALLEVADIRCIGVLLRLLEGGGTSTPVPKVTERLVALLPRLTPVDGGLVGKRDRARLRSRINRAAAPAFLHRETEPALAIAGIKALVQIRDRESLPTLRRLAEKARCPDVRRMAALGVAEMENGEAI